MSLADASLHDTAGQQVAIAFNPASAERLFAGSGHTFAEIVTLADERKPLPGFPLPTRVRATVKVETAAVTSDNVAGLLRGSDPTLRDEYIVLSGHLDHLGIGGAVNGDRIYNGAMDNASGIASLIETASCACRAAAAAEAIGPLRRGHRRGEGAARLALFRQPPDRAGEEPRRRHQHGHVPAALPDEGGDGVRARRVGSRRRDPAASPARWASPCRAILSRCATASSAATSTASSGRAYRRSPSRSATRPAPRTPPRTPRGRRSATTRPSDDLQQPVDREAAVGFNELLVRLTVALGDAPERPRWNDTSFFRRFAAVK